VRVCACACACARVFVYMLEPKCLVYGEIDSDVASMHGAAHSFRAMLVVWSYRIICMRLVP
jgi:hypothetical protein